MSTTSRGAFRNKRHGANREPGAGKNSPAPICFLMAAFVEHRSLTPPTVSGLWDEPTTWAKAAFRTQKVWAEYERIKKAL